MLKRCLIITLAILMVLSLTFVAGCGGSKNPANTPSGSNQNKPIDDDDYFLDTPEELKGTTVKFATWINHSTTDTAVAIAGFEEATGMKYEMVTVNESDYIPKVSALIASDQAPDVVVDNLEFPRTLSLLQPLSLEANGLDPKDPFWDQGVSELFSVGDKYYLVNGKNSSWHSGSTMTYFNKPLLDENGIKTPADYMAEDNWNLDTLWTLMTQIQSSCGLSRAGTSIEFEAWCSTSGGGQVKYDTKEDKFVNALTSEATKKAIKYLMDGQDQGLLKIINSHDEDLSKGNIALEICGTYGLRKNPGWFYAMDADDLGYAYFPKLNKTDAEYPTNHHIRGYGICKGAKNPVGAAYFLRYFLNDAHYDMNNMFKNEEAKNMYLELRSKSNVDNAFFISGVGSILDPANRGNVALVNDIISGTAAQVSVNLDKASSKIDGAVKAANDLIAEIKNQQ